MPGTYVELISAGRSRRLHSHSDVKTSPDGLSYGRGLPNRRIQRKVLGGSFRATRRLARGRVRRPKLTEEFEFYTDCVHTPETPSFRRVSYLIRFAGERGDANDGTAVASRDLTVHYVRR